MEKVFKTHWTDELRELVAATGQAGLTSRWNRWIQRNLNAWMSRLLMPAAFWPTERHSLELRRNQLVEQWQGQKWTIITPDQVQLDAMFFPAPVDSKARATLVYFGGNAESYETNPFVIPMVLQELGCNLVTFNYRQVGESDGAIDGPGMLIDGYSVLQAIEQYLLPLHTNQSLLLHGRSIGGAIATCVAATFQNGQRVTALCSERSFSSLDLVVSRLAPGHMASRFTSWMLRRSLWHFDPGSLWSRIGGQKIVVFHRLDTTVPHHASLYQSLSPQQLEQITAIELQHSFGVEPHNTPFYAPHAHMYDQAAFRAYCTTLAPHL